MLLFFRKLRNFLRFGWSGLRRFRWFRLGPRIGRFGGFFFLPHSLSYAFGLHPPDCPLAAMATSISASSASYSSVIRRALSSIPSCGPDLRCAWNLAWRRFIIAISSFASIELPSPFPSPAAASEGPAVHREP